VNRIYHPRCLAGKNCVIAVKDGGGAHLSPLQPGPYCNRCNEKRESERTKRAKP
jgi:hypothetical protein